MKVGLTGHQDLGSSENRAWVANALRKEIAKPSLTEGFTSLANGADQLYALLLTQIGKPYTVVVPCRRYELTFTSLDIRDRYRHLLDGARERVDLDFVEPTEEAFWAAGKKVVELSDYLIAVWNGRPAKGLGGTADVVRFGLNQGKLVVHINLLTRTVRRLGQPASCSSSDAYRDV